MQSVTRKSKARRFKSTRSITALMLREMVTSYGRSPGGYLWAILEPVGGLAVLTLAFSLVFRSPALGTNFPLFYATGFLPFMMYSDLANKIGKSIHFSRALLFYPSVTYVDAILARCILNALTHIMVFYIIMTAIMLIFDTQAILSFGHILNSLGMALTLGLGVGTLNCFLFSMFPLWERAWGILSRPLFIASAIFFLFESLPQSIQAFLWYNPLVHVVGEMRTGFYATYDAPYVSEFYVYGVGIGCFMIGLTFLGRFHRDILMYS